MELDEKTSVRLPIKTVFFLLAGCASFTTISFKAGEYIMGNDAKGADHERRIVILEQETKAARAERIALERRLDRRMYRMELGMHLSVPQADRLEDVK